MSARWLQTPDQDEDFNARLEAEFAHHLEQSARDLITAGRHQRDAREEAERRFGDPEKYRDRCRRVNLQNRRRKRRLEMMADVAQDLKVTFRSVRRDPIFSLGVILTLALAIGATTAIFSVVYGVVLKPLPFAEPERLVAVWEKNPDRGWMHHKVAAANVLDWRGRVKSFDDITTFGNPGTAVLNGWGDAASIQVNNVYGNFFSVLGVEPALGRAFVEEESWAGEEKVAVLSWGFYERHFGADPEILGQTIRIDGTTHTIIGVMPAGFHFPEEGIDVWQTFGWRRNFTEMGWFRRAHFLRAVARLRADVTPAAARVDLEAIAAQLEEENPEYNEQMGAGLTPLLEWTAKESRGQLWTLLGAVGLLLLVACSNIAGLQMARAAKRQREMSVRRALGARRLRLVGHVMTESFFLAAIGGILGLFLGVAGSRLLVAWSGGDLPRASEVGFDAVPVGFAIVLTILASAIFGLVPALRLSRANRVFQAAGGGSKAFSPKGLGGVVVATQVAMAFLLLIGAGLLVKSFHRLSEVEAGFEASGVLAAQLSLPEEQYSEAHQVVAFWQRLQQELRSLPAVEAVSLIDAPPMTGGLWTSYIQIEGRPPAEFEVEFNRRIIGPGYFETLGVPILEGRGFQAADDAHAPRVVVVNKALSERYFPGESPLGQRLRFKNEGDGTPIWKTIVGVVGNERIEGPDGRVLGRCLRAPLPGACPLLRYRSAYRHRAHEPCRSRQRGDARSRSEFGAAGGSHHGSGGPGGGGAAAPHGPNDGAIRHGSPPAGHRRGLCSLSLRPRSTDPGDCHSPGCGSSDQRYPRLGAEPRNSAGRSGPGCRLSRCPGVVAVHRQLLVRGRPLRPRNLLGGCRSHPRGCPGLQPFLRPPGFRRRPGAHSARGVIGGASRPTLVAWPGPGPVALDPPS